MAVAVVTLIMMVMMMIVMMMSFTSTVGNGGKMMSRQGGDETGPPKEETASMKKNETGHEKFRQGMIGFLIPLCDCSANPIRVFWSFPWFSQQAASCVWQFDSLPALPLTQKQNATKPTISTQGPLAVLVLVMARKNERCRFILTGSVQFVSKNTESSPFWE